MKLELKMRWAGQRKRVDESLRRVLQTTLATTAHEQWFIVLMAGLVGVYAGLAAGLFGGAINFFNIAFFHTGALLRALGGDPRWRAAFGHEVENADWNLSFLIAGLVGIALALGLDRLVTASERLDVLSPMVRRFRLIAVLTAVGIALYYPLILLRALNQSFGVAGDLAAIVRQTPWPIVLLVPALGGLASGLIVTRMTPTHLGHGVTEVMEAVVRDGAVIPPRVPFWKGLAAAVCTGAGGSVGREGPLVQIGSGVGSALGQHLGLSRANMTVLVGSGAAAGIAASFNAPIGGAMFALEIVLGDFGIRTFSPIVLASVMGTVTARSLLGSGSEVAHASYSIVSSAEIIPYAFLGVLAGLLSISYIVTMERVEHTFYGHRGGELGALLRRLPLAVRPAVGGLGVGLLGIFGPALLGTGYSTMNAALAGEMSGKALAAICAGKILATSLTLGSGGQGGSFFPATFIGAVGGGAFGALLHGLLPRFTASQGAYALVGMGAVVAGATQAPLTGIVMLFELTSDYQIILPLMVACTLATSLVHVVMDGSLYTRKLKERGILLKKGRDVAVMRSLTVGKAFQREFETVRMNASLEEVVAAIGNSVQPGVPVLDVNGELMGMLTLLDVRATLGEWESLKAVVRAVDLVHREALSAFPDEDFESVLERMDQRDLECLPVVDRAAPRRVIGLITRRRMLAAYEQAVHMAGLVAT